MEHVEGLVPAMAEAAAVIMEDLLNEVEERLRERGAKSQRAKALPEWLDAILFPAPEAGSRFVRDLMPQQMNALQEAGTEAVAEVGADVAFSLTDPAVQAYIKQRQKHIKTIAFNFHDALRDQLAEGYEAGESVSKIAARIEDFRGGVGFRAERIARTEIIGASNRGAFEGYTQAGVKQKKWIHTRGAENPREAHERLAGQAPIPIDEDWHSDLGGVGPCPGSLGPADDINCTCTFRAI